MVKVRGTGNNRAEALRLAEKFRARVIDAGEGELRLRDHRRADKIDQFVSRILPLGLVEVSRTGIVAISRGPDAM